jgi:hypothetical protein
MVRAFACVCALLALVVLVASGTAQDTPVGKPVRAQMVKGTIKKVDSGKDLLIVNQKLKGEVVDRELSIRKDTAFVIMSGKEKREYTGRDGLVVLEGKEGSQVQVQCDKDVNVLKVTVKIKN